MYPCIASRIYTPEGSPIVEYAEDSSVWLVYADADKTEGRGDYKLTKIFTDEAMAVNYVENIPDPWDNSNRAWKEHGGYKSYGHLKLLAHGVVTHTLTPAEAQAHYRASGMAKLLDAELSSKELEALGINPEEA